jgi:hypothetical protein
MVDEASITIARQPIWSRFSTQWRVAKRPRAHTIRLPPLRHSGIHRMSGSFIIDTLFSQLAAAARHASG